MRTTISIDHYKGLEERLSYDPETGSLRWKERPLSGFKTEAAGKIWNAQYPGKEVGSPNADGYFALGYQGKLLRNSRVIWYLMTGRLPAGDIDHKNGCVTDNRWANLRDCTPQRNCQNRAKRCNNTSGVIGVHWDAQHKKWRASIMVNGKHVRLGRFVSKDAAIQARQEAEAKHFGEFALSARP